jgi:hypothetical protein
MRRTALCRLIAGVIATSAGCSLDRGGLPSQSGGAGSGGASSGGCGGAGCTSAGSSGSATAGSGGGAACGDTCVDPHASCVSGTCECEPGYEDVDQGDPTTASCVSTATILWLKVRLAIDHSRLGNLTIKLQSPSGTVLTLMSRPGFTESADDGSANGQTWPPFNYGPSGDQSDLASSHPIQFWDGAPIDAEDMGFGQDGGGLAVCRDGNTEPGAAPEPECDYRPSPQSAAGPPSIAAAFDGELATGKWSLCVGDSDATAAGVLTGWALEITTIGGPVPVAAEGLGLAVPDNGYDGTPSSMICSALEVPTL